ncbi:MAG: helix-turn-helix domain-containing protein [Myxococcota bacterium]
MASGDQLDTLGKRLKWGRVRLGITQPQLGEAVAAESQQIWKYENDKRTPGPERLLQFARLLRLRPWWLVFGEGPREPDDAPPPAGLPEAVDEFLASDLAGGLSEWAQRALREMDWGGAEPDVGDVARLALGLQRIASDK